MPKALSERVCEFLEGKTEPRLYITACHSHEEER